MQTPVIRSNLENKASKSSKPNGKFFGKGQDMPFFQPKLTVNQPGDAYEQEADRVADQVMRMPDPALQSHGTEKNGTGPVDIQRKVIPASPAPVEVKQPTVTPVLSRVQPSLVQAKCAECSQKEKEQKEEERQEGKMPVMRATKMHDINATGMVPVQRACAACAKEEEVRRKETPAAIDGAAPVQIQRAVAEEQQEEEMPAMRKEANSDPGGKAAPSVVSDVLSSGNGRPLDSGTRQFMESRFGQDFGQVRIHTDAQAAESASAINARAYTSGNNVVFGNGEYQPETDSGRRLLAHELVHVEQQGGVSVPEKKPAVPAKESLEAEESVKETDQAEAVPGVEEPPLTISEKGAEKPPPEARADQKSGQQQDKTAVRETGRAVKSEKTKPKPEVPEKEPKKEELAGAEEGGGGKMPAAAAAEEPPPVELDTSNSAALLNSLGPLPATSFVAGMQKVGELAPGVQQQEKGELEQSLPVVEQPTGLPTKKQRELEKAELEKGQVPDIKPEGKKEGEQLEVKHQAALGPVPNNKTLVIQEPKENPEDGLSWWDRIKSILKRSFGAIQTKDDSVNTSAGERPKVDTTGEADPRQNDEARAKADESMTQEKQKADQSTQEYRGENDIYPDLEPEMLQSSVKPAAPEMREGRKIDIKAMTPDVRASLDVNLQERLNKEAAPEIAKNDAEYRKQQEDSDKERTKTDEEIQKETERVRELQENEQAGAKKQVSAERENWRKENEKVQKTYQDDATKKRQEIDGQIETEIKTTEKAADEKMSEAEKKAKAEKQKTEEEAERKKREEENRPRSWWDRLKGAVSDFFKKLKAAINVLFDALRKLVKEVIEAAKKVVNHLIDLARKAIVGFIKAFGEALKGFLKIALAAFPELRDKALAAVDKAVNIAVKVVNKLADGLKEFANKALDALGAALDFYLSLYQKAFNLIVDALEFLTIGLIKIMEGIANLVAAAREMPDHFWEQMLGELFGVDEPLPFERTAPPDNAKAISESVGSGALSAIDAGLLSKNALASDDAVADPVTEMELDPELNEQMLGWGDGEEKEFEGSENPLTFEEIKSSATGPEAAPGEAPDVAVQPDAAEGQAASGAPQQELSIDQQLEEMVKNIPETCEPDKNAKPAESNEFPEAQKIGPLTVNQRLSFVMGAMKKGISTWWECNKVAIVTVTVILLLGLVILEILTAGAITAAIPPLLMVLAAFFLAEALVKASSYFLGFFTKGFDGGNRTGAAKDLARALAILSIELIFAVVFELKAIFKALKGGMKAAMKSGIKFAKSSIKATGKAFKELGNIAVDGGKAMIKNGKLVFKGITKGFGKGVKNLDDLVKKLKDRFRFKRFKFRRNGMRFSLFGEINPWVLLATGEIVHHPGKTKNVRGKVVTLADGRTGKIIGAEGDKLADASLLTKYFHSNPAQGKKFYRILDTFTDAADSRKVIKALENYKFSRGRYTDVLDVLDDAIQKGTPGVSRLIDNLAAGGIRAQGAEWIIYYLKRFPNKLKDLEKFEEFFRIGGGRRFYDATIDGVRYEFKNWAGLDPRSYKNLFDQIIKDLKFLDSGNEFIWVWSKKIGSLSNFEGTLRTLLNDTALLKQLGVNTRDIKLLRSNIDAYLARIEIL